MKNKFIVLLLSTILSVSILNAREAKIEKDKKTYNSSILTSESFLIKKNKVKYSILNKDKKTFQKSYKEANSLVDCLAVLKGVNETDIYKRNEFFYLYSDIKINLLRAIMKECINNNIK